MQVPNKSRTFILHGYSSALPEGPSMVTGDALHQIDLSAGAAANWAIPAVADGPIHVPVEKILK